MKDLAFYNLNIDEEEERKKKGEERNDPYTSPGKTGKREKRKKLS